MTADAVILVNAPSASARDIAETMLRGLGVSENKLPAAQYHTATDETPEFGIPQGTDYHGYVLDQGLPAWVRVTALDDGYQPTAVADYEGWSEVQESIRERWASHLVRIIYGGDAGTRVKLLELPNRFFPGTWGFSVFDN
jgi:hypothetical protein